MKPAIKRKVVVLPQTGRAQERKKFPFANFQIQFVQCRKVTELLDHFIE